MKSICTFVLATAFVVASTGIVGARAVRTWSYQELLDKSDLVVIATPTATNDTKEHIDLAGFLHQPVTGIESSFAVSAVLKGDKALKEFVLHHYRADGVVVANGPNLVSFALLRNGHFSSSSCEKPMVATRRRLDRRTPEWESMSWEAREDERHAEPDHFTRRRNDASVR